MAEGGHPTSKSGDAEGGTSEKEKDSTPHRGITGLHPRVLWRVDLTDRVEDLEAEVKANRRLIREVVRIVAQSHGYTAKQLQELLTG